MGDTFSRNFAVTNILHEGFVDLFGDRNPLHIDDAFSIKKGFRGKVMHGNILGGFLSYFIGECLPIKDVIIHSQEIQYRSPAYINDTLVLEAKVVGVFESVGAVEFKFNFRNAEAITVATGVIQIGVIL
jgi:3-hydroxybutyryl-CoA dehydratase